jgi:hypothetical protein
MLEIDAVRTDRAVADDDAMSRVVKRIKLYVTSKGLIADPQTDK